ncbi:MAG TPA: dihydrodipicolinate reductase C-terminal domain-containing protein [Candidatus Dormibacteraeota bacterium]|nr:dihydrodipicolinate reductase C-terminal domain-containing protein [Candidatus Dormibacteraeota bacterium]
MNDSAAQTAPARLLLLGHGRMGNAIEQLAPARGFVVAGVLTVETNAGGEGLTAAAMNGADVVVDFTQPDAVLENIRRVSGAGKPMVVGTTGWYDTLEQARAIVEEHGTGLVYGANFSLGVQLFYRLAREAAKLFARWPQYEPFIVETHHRFKRDAPSGTALELARQVEPALAGRMPAIQSVRAGHIPGTHELGFDAEGETLIVRHAARSRQAFAEGALVAARWVTGNKGFRHFSEILNLEATT